MDPITSDNPITARLDILHQQWTTFSRAVEARLLIWCATRDEHALIAAFVAREQAPALARTSDVFARIDVPFHAVAQHTAALVAALRERVPTAEVGPGAPLPAATAADAVQRCVDALAMLRRRLLGPVGGGFLVLWLAPSEVSDDAAYLAFLRQLVRSAPATLRFVLVDDLAGHAYRALALAAPHGVRCVRCSLDVPAALVALAERAGGASAGDRLRVLVVRLAAILAAPTIDLAAARGLAAQAIAVARDAQLPALGAAVHMMLAGALVSLAEFREAHACYGAAARMASACRETSPAEAKPPGASIRLQAQFGQAGALLAAGAHAAAARAYAAAVPLAAALGDAHSELAAHRLASFCHAESGAAEPAWRVGLAGVARGLSLDPKRCEAADFAALARHQLRLTRSLRGYRSARGPLLAQVRKVLGPAWQPEPDR